jgi:Ni,Fe-hydrogenase III small subunit/formate hydrogenlyase subunit 6/NADH:ubiquinone oxidoreductase subunit I
MLKLISYLLSTGVSTVTPPCPDPPSTWRGIPALSDSPCQGSGCDTCADVCPTGAISVFNDDGKAEVALDLGACIQCGLCIDECPTGTIVENKTYKVAATSRQDLVLTTNEARVQEVLNKITPARKTPAADDGTNKMFSQSLHARVVSTGCSCCDAEIGASGNPVFDIERFGLHIVASPRAADVLFVTGPVSKGMQNALVRCYGAMADPRMVVALGTCAISGGMHKGGYAEANGADAILPVNVYVPGCPPHPWSIVHTVLVAQGKLEPFKPKIFTGVKKGEAVNPSS